MGMKLSILLYYYITRGVHTDTQLMPSFGFQLKNWRLWLISLKWKNYYISYDKTEFNNQRNKTFYITKSLEEQYLMWQRPTDLMRKCIGWRDCCEKMNIRTLQDKLTFSAEIIFFWAHNTFDNFLNK